MAKILLVEDDKSLREIYGVRLLAEGYDIVSAGDGEEALAMAIKERPNLIVSDVMMPKISGFDMLDILRSTTETKGIKVIMMTALSSDDQRLRGEQLGADRYLVKSQVGIEDVVRTVHEVLGDSMTISNANDFGPSAPSAVPRAAPPVAPRPEQSQPAPQPSQPEPQQQPQPQADNAQPDSSSTNPAPAAPQQNYSAEPTSSQTPAPSQPNVPAPTPEQTPAPAPAAAPTPTPSQDQPSSLPQPTAPFTTQRPAGLADRIIHPLERSDDSNEGIGSLMDRELGQQQQVESAPASQPAAPSYELPPAPVAPPAPELPPLPQSEPEQTPAPQPSFEAPRQENPISFEETPRQPSQQ